jgi:hypothetical protein
LMNGSLEKKKGGGLSHINGSRNGRLKKSRKGPLTFETNAFAIEMCTFIKVRLYATNTNNVSRFFEIYF